MLVKETLFAVPDAVAVAISVMPPAGAAQDSPVDVDESAVSTYVLAPTASSAGADAAVADIIEPFAVSVLLGTAALAVV